MGARPVLQKRGSVAAGALAGLVQGERLERSAVERLAGLLGDPRGGDDGMPSREVRVGGDHHHLAGQLLERGLVRAREPAVLEQHPALLEQPDLDRAGTGAW